MLVLTLFTRLGPASGVAYRAKMAGVALTPREYKVVLLGEPGVGKTSFFLRIRDGTFVDTESMTVTADACEKRVKLEGSESNVQVSLAWH